MHSLFQDLCRRLKCTVFSFPGHGNNFKLLSSHNDEVAGLAREGKCLL